MAIVQTSKILSESIQGIAMKFHMDVFWVTLYQIPSAHVDPFKNMAASGWSILPYMVMVQILLDQKKKNKTKKHDRHWMGHFCSLYGYSTNLKVVYESAF